MVEEQQLREVLLSARPPTPPRDSSRQRRESTDDGITRSRVPRSRTSSASNLTPASSLDSPKQAALRKKVGFSDSTQYSDPPRASFDGKDLTHLVQPLPPSAGRKPSKSILKAQRIEEDVSSGKLRPPHQHGSFAEMLQSVVHQLSKGDRSTKLDGYLALSGCLKASDVIPDIKALQEQLGSLCQFISRDMNAIVEGREDSSLIVNALILLSCLMFRPIVAESIPVNFQVFFVDHAARIFSNGGMSKDVVKHLLLTLAQQKFSIKVMNSERVGRLLVGLHKVENHVAGKSIVQGKIQVLRTLIRQARAAMSTHTSWIHDLFTDMLSSIREVRQAAIDFGLEASFVLGTEKGPSNALSGLFKLETSESITYADYFATRLMDMTKKKDEAANVPQIWSVMILFLRYKPQQLGSWKYMSQFLTVLQHCFNSSDKQTSLEAYFAWNRFIFAIQLTEQTSPNIRNIVFTPLMTRIKARKAHVRTLGTFHNLLYYAFRPSSSAARYDLYWDEYVVPLIRILTPDNIKYEFAGRDATDAATILSSLFDSKTQRKWSETRAMYNFHQNHVQVKELPPLDSKWLRKNAIRVHTSLSRIQYRLYWRLGDRTSAVSQLWQAYITSIASPAVMEVKVSMETMISMAGIFGIMFQIWNTGPASLPVLSSARGQSSTPAKADFLTCFEYLVLTTIEGLKVHSFTERLLSIQQDTFEAVATPSHQPKKMHGDIKPPLHHLILLLTRSCPGLQYDLRFSQMTSRILQPFFTTRKTSKAKLDLAMELMSLLPSENLEPVKMLWNILAGFAAAAVDTRDEQENRASSDIPLGSSHRDVIKLLEVGIRLSPDEPLQNWKILFEAVANSAVLDAGDSGKAIVVIEPLARALTHKSTGPASSPMDLSYLHLLLSRATFPRDRQALDAARKKLWGAVNTGPRQFTFDPYEKLYDYLQKSMDDSYTTLSSQYIHIYADMMTAVHDLFSRCPTQLLLGALAKAQPAVKLWIKDDGRKLVGGNDLARALLGVWSMILNSIAQLLQLHSYSKVLADLEVLICAGFESRHRTLVNATINSWNATFGSAKSTFEYPEDLKIALIRVYAEADEAIDLPFFPQSLVSQPQIDEGQHLHFSDPQDDYGEFPSASSTNLAVPHRTTQRGSSTLFHSSRPQVLIQANHRLGAQETSRENTSYQRDRHVNNRVDTTPAKLRHNDSQVHFEAIESSPMAAHVADSQLLTEKQRESRDRQAAEAAMFPDLRSSSKARTESLEPELPVHRSSSQLSEKAVLQGDRQTTPTLVIASDDDRHPYSSPTPTQSLREVIELTAPVSPRPGTLNQVNDMLTADNIPSSPPRASPEPMNIPEELYEMPIQFDGAMSESEDELPPPYTASMSDQKTTYPAAVTEGVGSSSDVPIPSAQPDPYAFEMNRSISSYVPTPNGDSELSSPSRQLLSAEGEVSSSSRAVGFKFDKGDASSIDSSVVDRPEAAGYAVEVSVSASPGQELCRTNHEVQQHSYVPSHLEVDMEDGTSRGAKEQLNGIGAEDKADGGTEIVDSSANVDQSDSPKSQAATADSIVMAQPQPSTPTRRQSPISAAEYSPKTPKFVDAVTSPVSSDNEFQDAVENADTSPPLSERNSRSCLSPILSDLDESSMLRVMNKIDHKIEKSPQQGTQSSPTGLTPRRRTRASATVPARHGTKSPSPRKAQRAKRSPAAPSVVSNGQETLTSNQSSSVPLLIPETPARQLILGVDDIYNDDGVLCALEDTIVVDTTDYERRKLKGLRTFRAGPGRRKSLTPASKKRKVGEAAEISAEMPDSQEVAADAKVQNEVEDVPSTKRRRRGRPRKASSQNAGEASQDSQQGEHDSSELHDVESKENSVDLSHVTNVMFDEATFDGQVVADVTKMDHSTTKAEPKAVTSRRHDIRHTGEEMELDMEEGQDLIDVDQNTETKELRATEVFALDDIRSREVADDTTVQEGPQELQAAEDDSVRAGSTEYMNEMEDEEYVESTLEEPETVEETIIYETTFFDESSSALAMANNRLHVENDVQDNEPDVEAILPSSILAKTSETDSHAPLAVDFNTVRAKLQSLITDLRETAFGRQEMDELEDLFFEAKRELYGNAGKRRLVGS